MRSLVHQRVHQPRDAHGDHDAELLEDHASSLHRNRDLRHAQGLRGRERLVELVLGRCREWRRGAKIDHVGQLCQHAALPLTLAEEFFK